MGIFKVTDLRSGTAVPDMGLMIDYLLPDGDTFVLRKGEDSSQDLVLIRQGESVGEEVRIGNPEVKVEGGRTYSVKAVGRWMAVWVGESEDGRPIPSNVYADHDRSEGIRHIFPRAEVSPVPGILQTSFLIVAFDRGRDKVIDLDEVVTDVLRITECHRLTTSQVRNDSSWRTVLRAIQDLLSQTYDTFVSEKEAFVADVGRETSYQSWDELWAAFAASPDIYTNQQFAAEITRFCNQSVSARSDALADNLMWVSHRIAEILAGEEVEGVVAGGLRETVNVAPLSPTAAVIDAP
ncbi:hypothetical protein V493_05617 [Pseudogymnoascus sp. VKM F-4281 (FW-2241)]|nr:hypothetical protein V493_05617 [Pseudogymnoascus sp. VKM F-4281 (FW-2241)]